MRYREQLGGFYSPTQLADEALNGLHVDTLVAHFVASPDSIQTIDVNHASAAEMAKHPYLSYSQAKAIYDLRRQQIRLTDIENLRQLPQVDSTDITRLRYYLRFE